MEYESAFKQFDINGDGVISTDELQFLLITVGMWQATQVVPNSQHSLVNHSLNLMASPPTVPGSCTTPSTGLKPSEQEVMIMIESVDMDDNGVLSICEFLQLMSKQHKPFITPKSQFEAVFRSAALPSKRSFDPADTAYWPSFDLHKFTDCLDLIHIFTCFPIHLFSDWAGGL